MLEDNGELEERSFLSADTRIVVKISIRCTQFHHRELAFLTSGGQDQGWRQEARVSCSIIDPRVGRD